ncbi:TonB-dependent receptor domain-containing protein [Neisseria shayeganii]|uniref:TonB-dependent receptor n=1 Tax=Neisseria shayeganii TaxID=607712 RepID=A0A7D7N599_9NEIS|nr:TonB-dependent receptor [Neisseria shayeganii]QMT39903.1 TonB-dependent receptor [Neisseria shayeganii]
MAVRRFPPCLSPKPIIVALATAYLAMPAYAADNTETKEETHPPAAYLDAAADGTEASNETTLPTIVVEGRRIPKDEIGHSRVYTRDISNVYKGRREIETYRGNSVSDLISGMVGVHSGDSRNSGAIDPNIRGVQGQGRIPVTVDGTEQSITVWRGYAGVNNRNYVDPNIISSVYVEKGPSLNREVRSGIGGAMAMKTIDADDIVPEGQKYGLEVRVETGNNSIEPLKNIYGNSVDYRTLSSPNDVTGGMWRLYFGKGDRQAQRFDGQNKFFGDRAFRIAAATKQENFDAMLAYAYRNKGNYFSGKNGGEDYGQGKDPNTPLSQIMTQNRDPYMPWIALLYHPGGEVTNTSLNTRSWLGKFTLRPAEGHTLKLGLRHTHTRFGEVMPSRLGVTPDTFGTVLQWPEAWVKQQAYNLDWRWKPQDSRWIDLNASLWTTRTRSKTNSAGGAPGDVLYIDTQFSGDRNQYDQFMSLSVDDFRNMGLDPAAMGIDIQDPNWREVLIERLRAMGVPVPNKPDPADYLKNVDNRFNTIAGEAYHAQNNRVGFQLSNRMRLRDNLELTLMGDIQYETLKGHSNFDEFFNNPNKTFSDGLQATNNGSDPINYNTQTYNVAAPRSGRRQEVNFGFNFRYRPFSWLTIEAGARQSRSEVRDENLQSFINRLKEANPNYKPSMTLGERVRYAQIASPEQLDLYNRFKQQWDQHGNGASDLDPEVKEWFDQGLHRTVTVLRHKETGEDLFVEGVDRLWKLDSYGRLHYKDHPNFSTDWDAQAVNPLDGRTVRRIYRCDKDEFEERYTNYGVECPNVKPGGEVTTEKELNDQEVAELSRRYGRSRWLPMLGLTAQIGDRGRLYARYAETVRFPSIFEGTVGFSTQLDLSKYRTLQPERGKNWEVGYVHDFTGLLPQARYADMRLGYFHNTTRNIYDRDDKYIIQQYDKQIRTGVEFQSRADFGRIFADLAVTRNLKNQVCDDAVWRSVITGEEQRLRCFNGGMAENGYLQHMVAPRWSVVANLGARFWDEKLEVGSRLTYHSRVYDTRDKSAREDCFAHWPGDKSHCEQRFGGGSAVRWQPVALWDAYVRYRINKHFSAELSGTNLTNRYYLDPLSRSFMPGPGRSIRLGISGKW